MSRCERAMPRASAVGPRLDRVPPRVARTGMTRRLTPLRDQHLHRHRHLDQRQSRHPSRHLDRRPGPRRRRQPRLYRLPSPRRRVHGSGAMTIRQDPAHPRRCLPWRLLRRRRHNPHRREVTTRRDQPLRLAVPTLPGLQLNRTTPVHRHPWRALPRSRSWPRDRPCRGCSNRRRRQVPLLRLGNSCPP